MVETMNLATGTNMRNGWEAQLFTREAVEHYWPRIQKLLEKVPHTWRDHTIASLYERAVNGNIQVWGIGPKESIDLVCFTQVIVWPATKTLEVFWAAGDKALARAIDIMDATLEEFGRVQGCERADIFGREGWERVLAKRGFKRSMVVLSRPIVQERRH